MAFLEVIHMTGDVDRRELSKKSPVAIGSHRSNDIYIDEDDVDIMHCRISWSKTGYEAVAAGAVPLELNGAPVKHAVLKPGDTLRFGTVDVRFRDGDDDGAAREASPAEEEFELLDDTPKAKRDVDPAEVVELDAMDADDDEGNTELDILGGLDALAAAERKSSGSPSRPRSKSEPPPSKKKSASPPRAASGRSTPAPAPPKESRSSGSTGSGHKPEKKDKEDPAYSNRLRQAMRHHQSRPGEEDLLRSPLVLTLLGVSGALLLTGTIFYFLAGRYTTEASFEQARTLYEESNFRAAIKELDDFAIIYSKHPLAVEARRLSGLARIRQHTGAAPNYPEGLKQLRNFINEQRDRDDFETVHPDIFEQARIISLGAAQAAGSLNNLALIEVSNEARTTLKTFAPKDVPPNEILIEIESAVRKSEASILRQSVYKDHINRIKAAIGKAPEGITAAVGERGPLAAMRIRQDLLIRYPDFERDKTVRELMAAALETERTSIVSEAPAQDALTEDHPHPETLLTLLFQGRTRSDEVAVGQAVLAVAQDCCYGLDLVTGAPIWRRVIGLDTPFFPVSDTATQSIIAFDTRNNELLRLNQHTGEFIWRQPIQSRVKGRPHLTEGTIFATTVAGELLAIDLESGRLRERLTFSQPVSGAAEIKSGQLVVAGDEEVLYELTKRPLECVAVHYLGQPTGSIEAPLKPMGSYLLMIQNIGENARLRLIETDTGKEPFKQVATGQVAGRVRDEPVAIRGRDLFVPSSGERLAAFSISDDAGQAPLTPGPLYQGKGDINRPIHLMTGPDRQVWMASGSLIRVQLTTDALQPDSDPVAFGQATQPLLYEAGYLFNARSQPYADSVILTRTDRDELKSDWQAVLGSRILAWNQSGDLLVCVNDSGMAFRVGARQWSSGRFLTDATSRLPLHADLKTPLRATVVSNNRIAIACGGPEPRAWVVNASGQIEASPQLPQPPTGPPVLAGDRIVIPMAGRMHAIRTGSQAAIQDFTLPTGDDLEWVDVVSAGTERAVGVTTSGILIQVRLQTSPRTHLAEGGRLELGAPVHVGMGANEQFIAIADATQRVTVLRADQLEIVGQRTFPLSISSRPLVVGNSVLVETDLAELHCLEAETNLPSRWDFPLQGSPLIGAAQTDTGLLLAQQNGSVTLVNPASGEVISQQHFGSQLALGPLVTPAATYVSTLDGTILTVKFE